MDWYDVCVRKGFSVICILRIYCLRVFGYNLIMTWRSQILRRMRAIEFGLSVCLVVPR